jgi:hypothetical protein
MATNINKPAKPSRAGLTWCLVVTGAIVATVDELVEGVLRLTVDSVELESLIPVWLLSTFSDVPVWTLSPVGDVPIIVSDAVCGLEVVVWEEELLLVFVVSWVFSIYSL